MLDDVRKFRNLIRYLLSKPGWNIHRICQLSLLNRPLVEKILKAEEITLSSASLALIQDFLRENNEHSFEFREYPSKKREPKEQKQKEPMPHSFLKALETFLASVPLQLDVTVKIRPRIINITSTTNTGLYEHTNQKKDNQPG